MRNRNEYAMEKDATLQMYDLAYGGDGVGRLDGMAVFVRGALPGETVRVQISQKKKRFAQAHLQDVLERSPSRIDPICPLAATCPGCAYQHLAYSEELAWKQRQLGSLLARLGGVTAIPDFVPIASPAELEYRNKVTLHVGAGGELGYIGHDNRTLIDVPDCPLAVAPIREAIRSVRDARTQRWATGDTVTFRWTETDGVQYWLNRQAPAKWLTEHVGERTWQVPAAAFWQVNRPATPLLLAAVSRMVASCSPRHLLDLYCGSGFFSLELAPQVEHVLGIEWEGEAVHAAQHNAALQGARNAVFIRGDAGGIYPEAQAQVSAQDTLVLVDPPRSGLAANLREALVQSDRPRNILYVSCAPDTLARDCKVLCEQAYRIKDIALLDMFPRTAHFESLVLLEHQ